MAIHKICCCLLVGCAAASNLCSHEDTTGSENCFEDAAASFVQMSRHEVHGNRVQRSSGVDHSIDVDNSKAGGVNHSTGVGDSKEVEHVLTIGDLKESPLARFKVAPVDCEKMSKPLQMVKDTAGYLLKELDVSTGFYTSLFALPYDIIEGNYTEINGCGINPMDSFIYCSMFADGSGAFIIRFDATTMEFVARLPWGIWNSGGFAASGAFYLGNQNAQFIGVTDLHKAKGFSDGERTSPKILDLRKKPKQKPAGFVHVADIVPVDADLEGNGIEEYIFVLYGPKLQIAKYDWALEQFTSTWVIDVVPGRWDNVFGAGWNFDGFLFFAANNGNGVYMVPLDKLNLKDAIPAGFKLELKRIGNSSSLSASDGLNCLNQPSPWATGVNPFNCGSFPGPIQALIHDDGYDVKFLDLPSGNYTNIYSIFKNRTQIPFQFLNAFSISPIDYIVYASLVIDDWDMSIYPTPPPFYIVRIDSKKIEFVAKVQAPFGSPIAGTFDIDGNFYIISNPSLLKFWNVGSMKGFLDPNDEALPFLGPDSSMVIIENMTGTRQIADIVAVTGNFDGAGNATWVLAANAYMQLICMKVSSGEYYIVSTNDVLGTTHRQNFGAGWNFMGEIFFASNDGAGVFQVPLDQIQVPDGPSVVLEKVGDSDPIYNNDGMNCIRTYSPFSKKAGTFVEPFGGRVFKGMQDLAMSLIGWLFI